MRSFSRRFLSTAVALILLATACGGSGGGDALSPAADSGRHEAGSHDATQELAEGVPVPTSEIDVAEEDTTIPAGQDHDHDHHTGAGGGHHASPGAATRYEADLADAVQTVRVDVVGGGPVGGVRRVEVELGSVVALMVASDIAEEVHVHGYDILRAASDGQPAHFAFAAEIPGVFEVEFEGSGRLLVLLAIS